MLVPMISKRYAMHSFHVPGAHPPLKDDSMDKTLFVINPNSNKAVTAGIDVAMTPFRSNAAVQIECLTLAEGPPGIQSERDVASVALPMEKLATSLVPKASAFVIACFSDPGIHLMREAMPCPVYGIAESGAFTAMMLGHKFGVIAILEARSPAICVIGTHWGSPAGWPVSSPSA